MKYATVGPTAWASMAFDQRYFRSTKNICHICGFHFNYKSGMQSNKHKHSMDDGVNQIERRWLPKVIRTHRPDAPLFRNSTIVRMLIDIWREWNDSVEFTNCTKCDASWPRRIWMWTIHAHIGVHHACSLSAANDIHVTMRFSPNDVAWVN